MTQSQQLVKNTGDGELTLGAVRTQRVAAKWSLASKRPESNSPRIGKGEFKIPPISWHFYLDWYVFTPYFILRKSNRLLLLLQADILISSFALVKSLPLQH